jgi:peptide/nickel transport system substrate-binding protein
MPFCAAIRRLHLAMLALLALSGGAWAESLTIGVRAGPESMDPHYVALGNHAEAMKHVFDTLVWSDDELKLAPGLAESWKAVDDTTWEFKLRKGVKFHDGSDFTAEDVKFSIERIPAVSGPAPTTVYIRRVQATEIVDPYTLRVKTDGPAPSLPYDFVRLFVVSAKAAKNYSTKETSADGFNSGKAAIGTGPFKFVSWTPKQELVLERFDGYWGAKPAWDKVVRRDIPNDTARVAALKAGQIDIAARIPAADYQTLVSDPKLRVVKVDSVYLFNVRFDFREKPPQVWAKDGSPLATNPLRDLRVRKAMDMAIDRATLVEIAMEGLGTPATQIITPGIFGYNPAIKGTPYDPAGAKQLLAEAGFPNGFKVTFSFTNDRLPGDRAIGTTISQMLAKIGIDATANAVPASVYFPSSSRREISMGMSGWGTLTGEAMYTLSALFHTNDEKLRMGAFNFWEYSNPKLDKLIEEAAVTLDDGKRKAMFEEAMAIGTEDRPLLPITIIQSVWAMNKRLTLKGRTDEDTLAQDIKPAP